MAVDEFQLGEAQQVSGVINILGGALRLSLFRVIRPPIFAVIDPPWEP